MELFKAIEQSASLYPYFDYAHGYGMPQASWFTDQHPDTLAKPTFTVDTSGNDVIVTLDKHYFADSLSRQALKKMELYYHISRASGVLAQYDVIRPKEEKVLTINWDSLPAGSRLMIRFDGYTEELKF
jgi:hypothetical protein